MFIILATAFLDILWIGILIPVLPDIIIYFWVSESWNPYSQWIYSIGMFLWWLIFWRLSDKYGRKNLLSITTGLNLIGYIVLYISLSKWLVNIEIWILFIIFLIARFISWLGWSWLSVAQAYISDISNKSTKTKNMWMIWAAFGFAFLIWPSIWGILSKWGIEYVILWCIVSILINLIVILIVLKEPKKHLIEMNEEGHVPFHFSRTIIILFILSFGWTLAFSSIQSWSSQFYQDVFWLDAHERWYLLSLVWLIAIIYQWWLIKYVRGWFSEIKMIHISLGLMSLSILFFALNRNIYLLYFINSIFPIAMWTFQPAINSIIAEKAGKEVGKIMGYNTSVISIAGIIGPFIVGTLYILNYSLPFIVSSIIAFILFFIALLGLKK